MKTVKIIVADIRLFSVEAEKIIPQIAPCYAKKYYKSKMQREAEQELITGYLLKKYLGVKQDKQLFYNEQGKPFLVSGEKYFNISHSEDYVVLAIADYNIGVDIERIRNYHEATVKKIFNSKQKAELVSKAGEERNEVFTRIWTECEAVLKLKGIGFAREWEQDSDGKISYAIRTTKIDDYILTCVTQQTDTYITYNVNENGGIRL